VIRRSQKGRGCLGEEGRVGQVDRTRKFPRLASAPTFSAPALPGSDPQDPRKPGIPAEMDQIPPGTPFSGVLGGVPESRKLPHDTRTVPENDRLQLMPPPGDLCLFGPIPDLSGPHGPATRENAVADPLLKSAFLALF
jgi:hypothetical protein